MRPNQLVAYNFRRARQFRGWTQEDAAERLEPYVGARWTKAAISAIERSATGAKPREFTADDLAAFAGAFELPIIWFFLLPEILVEKAPKGAEFAIPEMEVEVGDVRWSAGGFFELVLGGASESTDQALDERLRQVLANSEGPSTRRQREVGEHADRIAKTATMAALGDIPGWTQTLRDLADHLEGVARDAVENLRKETQ